MAPIELSTFGLRAVDFIFPTIGSAVLMYILVKCSRRTWMLADATISATFALIFFIYPTLLLRYEISGEPQSYHAAIARAISAPNLGCALLIFFTRDCADNTVSVSILTSRIVTHLAVLPMIFYTWYKDSLRQKDAMAFVPEVLLISVIMILTFLLGNMCHLFRSRYYAGYSQRSTRVNLHLRIDFFLSILFGCAMFGMPDMMFDVFLRFGRPDAASLYMIKVGGALTLGSAFQALEATGYMYYEDKRHFFHARAIPLVLLALNNLYTHLGMVWQPMTLLYSLPLNLAWLINCKLACNDIQAFLDDTRAKDQ